MVLVNIKLIDIFSLQAPVKL